MPDERLESPRGGRLAAAPALPRLPPETSAATGLDVAKQYAKLRALFEKTGLDDEARWIEKRLRWIERG